MDYLFNWHLDLRRGCGDGGLSWSIIAEWSRFTGNEPLQNELSALFVMEAAAQSPDAFLEPGPVK